MAQFRALASSVSMAMPGYAFGSNVLIHSGVTSEGLLLLLLLLLLFSLFSTNCATVS